jgi:hypothetical protein
MTLLEELARDLLQLGQPGLGQGSERAEEMADLLIREPVGDVLSPGR